MQQFRTKDNYFITKGFSNWKQSIERFRSQQNTDYHIHFTSLSSICDQSEENNKAN